MKKILNTIIFIVGIAIGYDFAKRLIEQNYISNGEALMSLLLWAIYLTLLLKDNGGGNTPTGNAMKT